MKTINPMGEIRERPFARSIARSNPRGIECLTDREREILRAVCLYGATGANEYVYLQYQTIKNHLTAAFKKLGMEPHERISKIGRSCYQLGKWDERHGID